MECATKNCDRVATWITIHEGNVLGSKAPRRCTVCCEAIAEAENNIYNARQK